MENQSHVCFCNKKEAISIAELMDLFEYDDVEKFINDFVEEAKVILTKRGEAFENHIIDICVPHNKHLMVLFSPLAARIIAMTAANRLQSNNMDVYRFIDDCEYSKNIDTSFFVNPKNPNRELRVGDSVEVLTTSPDVLYPATAMINYKGMKGSIVKKTEKGNYHVVVNPRFPAAEFTPDHLKLIIKK